MSDQAARLREMAAAFRSQVGESVAPPPVKRTRVIAITSGKGGVGKSNVSVNLAHALAARGQKVVILDADLGLANADILMGTVPPYHLGHLLSGERQMSELAHRTPHGIHLIAGGYGQADMADMNAEQLQFFISQIQTLDGRFDYLILDTGAGLGAVVQEFTLASDQIVIVTTPEPTALADAYALIKTLVKRNAAVDFKLVVNQADSLQEGEYAAQRISMTAADFLHVKIEHVGTVPRDAHVWQAVRQQVPFYVAHPGAPASRAIDRLIDRMGFFTPAAAATTSPKQSGFFDRLTKLFDRRSAG